MMRIRPSRPLLAGALALAAVVVYANSLANGFAYDDVAIIHDDARVHGLRQLAAIFTRPYWADYGKELGLYRPLTTLGFAVQWTIAGGAPWLFHVGNIALHAAVCVLLFLLLARFAGEAAAFVGSLVFAVHPLHTEVVSNVVGQAELLAALGVLAAGYLWLGRDASGSARPRTVLAVALAYAVGTFSKESAIVAPALLVALDFAARRVPLSRAGLRAYARAIAPLMATLAGVAALYLGLRYLVIGSLGGGEVAPSMPFLARDHFWMGLRTWPEYARLLFFPQALSADYSPAVILPVHGWTPETLLGAALLAGIAAAAAVTPWRPAVGLPAAWFLLSILIVSNLFFPIGVVLAERTLYLPSAALAILIAFAWPALERRYPRPALAVAVAALVVSFGIRTWLRTPDWKDQDTVVRALIRDHPESYRAQWHLAARAFGRGDLPRSDTAWALAYRLWNGDSRLLAEYASYEIARGHTDHAQQLLDQSLAIHPGRARPRELYATALIVRGRYAEALAITDSLLPKWAAAPAVNDLRARAFMGLGDFPRAVDAWRRVVRAYPGSWLQWSGLGRSLARTGDFAGALAALDTARIRAGADSIALRQVAGFRRLTLRQAAAAIPTGSAARTP